MNPHDALSPERSASIVVNHVKDGLQMAERARLPESIRQFIREHHGAGMAKYFYITYCKAHPERMSTKHPFLTPDLILSRARLRF